MTMQTLRDHWTEKRLDELRFDDQGLLPMILQDVDSGQVLTLVYTNREALERMIASEETWAYSRSRQELWHKGATSGNTQKVLQIMADCDSDALVAMVRPAGPACHTGAVSCFAGSQPAHLSEGILHALESRIAERERERPEGAYTTYLFTRGLDKILKKVGEETAEVIIAAKNRDADELQYETADLLYHLFVLLREQGISLASVLAELRKRYVSGERGGKL